MLTFGGAVLAQLAVMTLLGLCSLLLYVIAWALEFNDTQRAQRKEKHGDDDEDR